MQKDYDMLVIGMGPGGMALSAMGTAMGLRVLAIEKDKLGGECLNTGCIPSKALLKISSMRRNIAELEKYALGKLDIPLPIKPFEHVQDHLKYINEEKTAKMLSKAEIIIDKGGAAFVDAKTVAVGGKSYRAKRIYIATGTKPFIPPIPGIDEVEYLTNENLFFLKEVPESMFVIGGGAIGCEMAQAFARLGTRVVMAHMDAQLMPQADAEAAVILQQQLTKCGVEVYNSATIKQIGRTG